MDVCHLELKKNSGTREISPVCVYFTRTLERERGRRVSYVHKVFVNLVHFSFLELKLISPESKKDWYLRPPSRTSVLELSQLPIPVRYRGKYSV